VTGGVDLGSISAALAASTALLAFVVSGLLRPYKRDRQRQRRLAEQLAVRQALRDQQIDERLSQLVRVQEMHERRIAALERVARRNYPHDT